jgi:hypothetical protein
LLLHTTLCIDILARILLPRPALAHPHITLHILELKTGLKQHQITQFTTQHQYYYLAEPTTTSWLYCTHNAAALRLLLGHRTALLQARFV